MLEAAIAGDPPPLLPRALAADPDGKALFGVLVEGLADRFEPALCDVYARLFSQAIAYTVDGLQPRALEERYRRVRRPRPAAGAPRRVLVLSRVTLGADVAVTSVVLAAAKRRFPEAEIVFVGPLKNYELFAADPHVRHHPVEYRRGSLSERLAVWDDLKTLAADSEALVLDPDSRLTQLGMLPIGAEERYHLFESRSYGAPGTESLPELAARWAEETLGVAGAKPYVALAPCAAPVRGPYVAVSLGVGDNPAKRIEEPFEERLLDLLVTTGMALAVDRGAGGREADRVTRAVERSGAAATFWEGSFAGFAALIAASRLYVGYDSAGQHVAAACGVPLVSIFAGFPVKRMFDRWRPVGEHCRVVRVDRPDMAETLEKVAEALRSVRPRPVP